jgi:von Hippel-Lindau disease tumor supressor
MYIRGREKFSSVTIFLSIAMVLSCIVSVPALAQQDNGCSNAGNMRSIKSNRQITVVFANGPGRSVNVYWINFTAGRQLYKSLGPNERYSINTFIGHSWVVTDTSNNCVMAFVANAGGFVSIPAAANNFVDKRYYCRSAQQPDAGDRSVSANGSTCASSRQAIEATVQQQGGDPCHAFDQSWSWNGKSEEIQVTGCPRQ